MIRYPYMKLISFLIIIVLTGCSSAQNGKADLLSNVSNGSYIAEKLIQSFISIHPDTVAYPTEKKSYKWNYEQGLILESIYRLWKETGKEEYYRYFKKNVDYYVEEDGSIKTYKLTDFNIDNISPGLQLLHLYEKTGELKYKNAAEGS